MGSSNGYHMVRQECWGNLAYNGMAIEGTVLWKPERCIKLGHIDVHQENTFPGLEGDWIQKQIESYAPLMTTYVHDLSGHRSLQQCKAGLHLEMFFLHPLRHKTLKKLPCLSAKETATATCSVAYFLREDSELGWQSD